MKNIQNIQYERKDRSKVEYLESLQQILRAHAQIQSLRYFAGQAAQWYQRIVSKSPDSKVVILGTAVPEELIMAAQIMPLRILGGSRQSCQWSDELVPRDTDPVSRSLMGYVRCLQQSDQADEILYIIPSVGDSMRKLAYQMTREGSQVFVLDIPPVKGDLSSQERWKKQLNLMMERTAGHVRGRITSDSLYRAVRTTAKARICLHEFTVMAPEYEEILSPSARILVQNSYSYAEDLDTWTCQLKNLMREIQALKKGEGIGKIRKPRILLAGSPVYFPNTKIPELMRDAGLCVWRQADVYENMQYIIPKIGKDRRHLRKMITTVASAWYRSDASTAYLKNEVLRRKIRSLSASRQIDGVVFHILKGQIEQDFELAYAEQALAEYGIPVFRLETDYQYQDVEQLRIRLEAFAEMLNQGRPGEQEVI